MDSMRFDEVANQVAALFERCPQLSGFSLDGALCVADVALESVDLPTGAVGAEISRTLLELIDENPQAAEWLRGRTFVRTLH